MKMNVTLGLLAALLLSPCFSFAQTNRLAVLGSSTAAGLATSSPDSSWVRRVSFYYKNTLGVLDTAYNLGVSGSTLYHGMPLSYTPPAGRPSPDPQQSVTRSFNLLAGVTPATNAVTIINFPSGGYDTYTISEIMSALQLMYDSAVRTGNRCYVTTTQPRTDGSFAASAIKRKLADIKDSIIRRFGVAQTINFWDGMYNPEDTTILSAYSAGDNVHFNNAGHRVLFERVRDKNIFALPAPQYRSNVNPTGLWSDAASWQVFDGSTWIAATVPPSMGSGAITILAGDSIRVNSFAEADQLTIENGGVLTVFNVTGVVPAKCVFTINNGAGDDLVNNGRLYVSANGILNGNGNLRNTANGLLTIRNRGVMEVPAVNDGTTWVNNTGILRNTSFINNRIFVLQNFTLQLISSSLTNNDSLSIIEVGANFFADSTLSGGSFVNAAAGVVCRQAATGSTTFSNSITLTNNGRMKGRGEYIIFNPAVGASGIIEPGLSPGVLTINPAVFNSRTPVLQMELASAGAVAGVNYDQLLISAVSTVTRNLSGTTLRVTDNANDPVGTVYTLVLPSGGGTLTGAFSSVQMPGSLSGPFYNGGAAVTVIRIAPLPLKWGTITAGKEGDAARVNWTTLSEERTAFFDIEHSMDGRSFAVVGRVAAAGSSSSERQYSFLHQAAENGTNYYRIRQVDIDNRYTWSPIVGATLYGNNERLIFGPNPVRHTLNIKTKKEGLVIVLLDQTGRELRRMKPGPGETAIDMQMFPAGIYQLTVYENQQLTEKHKILLSK